jgi:hypothetical protein
MINKNFAETLEQFINDSISQSSMPVCKGNTVKIKNYFVRKTKTGYIVVDIKKNNQVAHTKFKTSAVAIAKGMSEGKNNINRVLYLDNIMLKNYNDAVFYKHIIQKSNNSQIQESRRVRLEIALDRTTFAKQSLEDLFFK